MAKIKKVSELEFKPVTQDDTILTDEEIEQVLAELNNWELVDYGGSHALYKSFKTGSFTDAQKLAVLTGDLAEKYNHHPILSYTWGKLEVYWYTHSLKGVHWNDIFMAANTDMEAEKSKLLR